MQVFGRGGLLLFWVQRTDVVLQLEADVIEMNNILQLTSYIPKIFNQRPRSFKHFAKFKGSVEVVLR